MKNKNTQSGFTLVEILIATMIFAVTSVMFMGVFSMISNATLRDENRRFAQQDARYAMEQISRELRQGWDYEVAPDQKTLKYNIQDEAKNTMTCNLSQQEITNPNNVNAKIKVIAKKCSDDSDSIYLTSDISNIESLIFEEMENGGSYPIVMVKMQVRRKDFDRLGKTVTVSTMVTSRMRDNELICREQYPPKDELSQEVKDKINALCEAQ